MNDEQILEAKVAGLEREIRRLRMTLWDEYAKAALTGLLAHFGSDHNVSVSLAACAHADWMLAQRQKREVE